MAVSIPAYAWPFVISAFACGLLVLLSLRHRATGIARYFLPLATAALCWSGFAAITHVTDSPTAKIFWTHLRYVPISLLPLAWLLFSMAYTGSVTKLRLGHALALLAIPVTTMMLVATYQMQDLMFSATWIETTGVVVSVGHTYGPWFWVHSAYSYALFLAGSILILAQTLRTGSFRAQAIVMALGALSPALFNIVYLSSPEAFNHLDPTPIAFAFSTVCFGLAQLRYKLFDILPAARSLAFENITDGAIVLDHSGVVLDLNPAAAWLLDTDAETLSGAQISSTPDVLQVAWDQRHAPAACGDASMDFAGSTRWLEWSITPLAMGRIAGRGIGRGWLVILRDGTAHKEVEHHLRQARDRAVELSQLKSNFLANMNHEFRTPLAGIIGLSDILIEELEGEPQQLSAMIREGGDRLLNTLDAVLSAMDLYSGKLRVCAERLDVGEHIRSIAPRFAGAVRDKNLTFSMDLGVAPVIAELDPGHLRQAVSHLVDNAVKYTDEGFVSVRLDRTDREVSIHVADSGRGISAEFLPHVFEAFRQESSGPAREFEGVGLGLQITKGLTEAMEGRISVVSSIQAGSTFTLTFPLAQDSPTGASDRPAMALVPAARKPLSSDSKVRS